MRLQLDLFEEEKSDLDNLREDISLVRQSCDKVRKSLFAKHAELAKKYLEIHARMEILEKGLCAKK